MAKTISLIKNDINKCWQECRANETLNSMPEERELFRTVTSTESLHTLCIAEVLDMYLTEMHTQSLHYYL